MSPAARHRWSVASRALAAIIGGHVLTTILTAAVTHLLTLFGVSKGPALMWMWILSFLLWAAIIMAVFHARSAKRAWAWLAGCTTLAGLIVWWFLWGRGA